MVRKQKVTLSLSEHEADVLDALRTMDTRAIRRTDLLRRLLKNEAKRMTEHPGQGPLFVARMEAKKRYRARVAAEAAEVEERRSKFRVVRDG